LQRFVHTFLLRAAARANKCSDPCSIRVSCLARFHPYLDDHLAGGQEAGQVGWSARLSSQARLITSLTSSGESPKTFKASDRAIAIVAMALVDLSTVLSFLHGRGGNQARRDLPLRPGQLFHRLR
jgi:hypothetical protein